MNTALNTLADLKTAELKRDFPVVPEYAVPRYKYEDKTTNGLTRCIIDFIRVTGGHAERVNTTGRVIKQGGHSMYIQTAGTRGSADIHSMKCGRFVAVEIKIGADRLSQHQKRYREKVERGGGVYLIARSFDQFVEAWNKI